MSSSSNCQSKQYFTRDMKTREIQPTLPVSVALNLIQGPRWFCCGSGLMQSWVLNQIQGDVRERRDEGNEVAAQGESKKLSSKNDPIKHQTSACPTTPRQTSHPANTPSSLNTPAFLAHCTANRCRAALAIPCIASNAASNWSFTST